MYCSQCGKEVSGNARYCPACGARQEMGMISAEDMTSKDQTDRKKRQKAHRQGRRLGNFLVTVIALLILFSGDETVPAVSNQSFQQMNTSCFAVQDQREMAVCDAKGRFCIVDLPQQILYSADHSKMAYVDRDQELYYMDGLDPVFIDDGVRDAGLSFYGDTIVYVKDGESSRSELCICTIRTETTEQLKVSDCRAFCISPDGKSVACIEADGTLRLWQPGSEAVKIAGNVSEILALTEDGEMLLYRKEGNKLFRYLKGKEEQMAEAGGSMDCIRNEKQDEILYTAEGSTWYYAMNLKEPVRLSGVKGNLLTSCYMPDTACQQDRGLILGRRSLKSMTFATYDSGSHSYRIYHLNWNGKEAEPVLNHAEQFQISESGRSVLYLSDRKLYQIRDIRDEQDRTCISGTMNVSGFTADSDLKKVWFSTFDRELYYAENEKCRNVSSDLNRIHGCIKDGALFQEGQDLYLADGAEKVLVKGDVREAWIQENEYVMIKAEEGICYLKDLKEEVCLTGGR